MLGGLQAGAYLAVRQCMHDTMTLAELRARGVRFRADEAVAIAQQLMCGAAESRDAHPPYGLLSEETVAIGPDGRLYCSASATTPSVAEVAILMQELLEEPGSAVPGGLRYAIGRALLEVEAPPFDSLDEFRSALGRFEQALAPAVLTRLYSRAAISASNAPADLPAAYRGIERRRHMPSSTELRRQLRDTDRRLFEASRPVASRRPGGGQHGHARAPFTAGIVACSALIAAGGLAYAGELAYTRLSGARHTSQQNSAAQDRSSSPGQEPILATTFPTTLVPLPTNRALDASWRPASTSHGASPRIRPASVITTPGSHQTRRLRGSRLPPQPDRHETDEQRARAQKPQDDDRGALVRLRFEWDNPFRRSH
jgi:hypothetical protein